MMFVHLKDISHVSNIFAKVVKYMIIRMFSQCHVLSLISCLARLLCIYKQTFKCTNIQQNYLTFKR